jgi:hypothetical protein
MGVRMDDGVVDAFLARHGAAGMPHPGGTLLAHLHRVRDLLAGWGAERDVRTAGLCHATYGTDGFGPVLLPPTDRAPLAELVGVRVEGLVHLYASCDRGVVYPRLGREDPLRFRDRFTGGEHVPAEPDLRAFLEITAANELDVLAHNAELAERHGAGLYRLLTRAGALLSPAARDAVARQLGPYAK